MSWKISGIQSSGGNSGGNSGGGIPSKGGSNSSRIYNSQGKFHTGCYQNWNGKIKVDSKTANAAHKQKGSKYSHTTSKKEVTYTKLQLSEIYSSLINMKAYIAAFSSKPQGTYSCEVNNRQEAPYSGEERNYFGRRAAKRTNAWLVSPLAFALISLMMFVSFYLLTRLGGHNPTRDKSINTIQINQV